MEIVLEDQNKSLDKILESASALHVILLSHYLTNESLRIARMMNCAEILQDNLDQTLIQAILKKYSPEKHI